MDWTDETIARLRELWDQGLSTAEIGRQLEITKNAVVGKAHRLGLPPRPSPIRNRKTVIAADGTVEVPKRKPPTRSKAKPKVANAEQGSLLPEAAKKSDAKVEVKAAAPSEAAKAPPAEKRPAPAAGATPKKIEASASSGAQGGVPKDKATTSTSAEEPKRALSSVVGHSGAPRMAPAIDRPVRRGPSCCWPFGDPGTPGFHFCGARPLSGKPYCAEHAAIAYVKIRDRRD
ncbi:GcrA family cell cycle regulator [Neokomagataea anthophila]|uniref:GcrA cell cycle regulator n=1 Tax=Neokomagataea anthophila TaxID=2826925 RepID=A0ABS5E7L6_9PROT|nr:GcrA family cell cycle regulator [Neokomagataea anthophila]MBR0559895.1 GcrA cell cycle regulator [Neokomagataea anthophila]